MSMDAAADVLRSEELPLQVLEGRRLLHRLVLVEALQPERGIGGRDALGRGGRALRRGLRGLGVEPRRQREQGYECHRGGRTSCMEQTRDAASVHAEFLLGRSGARPAYPIACPESCARNPAAVPRPSPEIPSPEGRIPSRIPAMTTALPSPVRDRVPGTGHPGVRRRQGRIHRARRASGARSPQSACTRATSPRASASAASRARTPSSRKTSGTTCANRRRRSCSTAASSTPRCRAVWSTSACSSRSPAPPRSNVAAPLLAFLGEPAVPGRRSRQGQGVGGAGHRRRQARPSSASRSSRCRAT